MGHYLSQQPPPPEKGAIGKGVKIGVALAVVIIALVVIGLIFVSILNRPKPEITLVTGYESFQGLNYVYVVDVTVKNNGADGWVKVYAEISGAGRYEKQETRIYMGSGESWEVTFTFDISLWGALTSPSITYRAWAVAD